MKRIFLLGMILTTFLAGCAKEKEQVEDHTENAEEINFGPSPGG